MKQYYNLVDNWTMFIVGEVRHGIFSIKVRRRLEEYPLDFSVEADRLVHDRHFYKCESILPSLILKKIEDNCRRSTRTGRM